MPGLPDAASARASGDGRDRRQSADRQLCQLIATLVATALGVAIQDVRSPQRGQAPVAFARQAAMYLGHVVFGLSLTRIGHGFGRDRTARLPPD